MKKTSMNKEQFWKIIEASKRKSGKDMDAMQEHLLDALLQLHTEDIYHWGQYFGAYHHLSDTEPLYLAAYITGSGSDDSFEYFRCWLITQGQKVFKSALADPDSLSKIMRPGDVFGFEQMMGIAYEAYADRLNETDEAPLLEMDASIAERQAAQAVLEEELRGEMVFADATGLDSEEACIGQIPKRVPRLCRKFDYDSSDDDNDPVPDDPARAPKTPGRNADTGYWEIHSFASYTPNNDEKIPPLPEAGTIDSVHIHQGKYLRDISNLAAFTAALDITFDAFETDFAQLSDFSVLYQHNKLENLSLANMPQLTDIGFVRNMPHLNRLCLSNLSALTDLSPIEGLEHLETLVVFECPKIETIPSLAASAQTLKQVRFIDNKQLRSVAGLCGLPSVKELWLQNNCIEDISPLAGFSHLKYLDLGGNKITDIEVLRQIPNLEHLDLSRNKIVDIAPLENLRTISHLLLPGNRITDISPLSGLQEVGLLNLAKNKHLADISPLRNTKIGGLEIIRTSVTDFSPIRRAKFIHK